MQRFTSFFGKIKPANLIPALPNDVVELGIVA
jgi:hypothetical protein